jgi:hypothetical protein
MNILNSLQAKSNADAVAGNVESYHKGDPSRHTGAKTNVDLNTK